MHDAAAIKDLEMRNMIFKKKKKIPVKVSILNQLYLILSQNYAKTSSTGIPLVSVT